MWRKEVKKAIYALNVIQNIGMYDLSVLPARYWELTIQKSVDDLESERKFTQKKWNEEKLPVS